MQFDRKIQRKKQVAATIRMFLGQTILAMVLCLVIFLGMSHKTIYAEENGQMEEVSL